MAGKTINFEDGLKRIEEITALLEQGDLSLDQAVAYYTEGVKLSASCQKVLEHAKLKLVQEQPAQKKHPVSDAQESESD